MKRVALIAVVMAASAAMGFAASAWADVTVGSTSGTCNFFQNVDVYSIETAPSSYVIPMNGKITQWSFVSFGIPQEQLKVFRPLGGGSYRVVGQSGAVIAAGGTFATSIKVSKGDLLGIANLGGGVFGGACADCCSGGLGDADFGDPQPGDVVTPTIPNPVRYLLSVDLQPSSPTAKTAPIPQVNHLFLCYSKFQTDPGVWDSDTAALLLKAGYWLPYALPGAVDGATNLGDFHLACNLTGTQTPTGGFVDDGGGTWSPDFAAMTGLYPAAA